ncbi:hypothetical protein IP88_11840 [alpha proteobacterium AAP81b]|nr:hypothetical protein IP88_11840 [alpha proteobacterium AAP81b]
MANVIIVGGLDVAELCFYAFFLFFIGLVIYLRREDRREGYPLEDDMTGWSESLDAGILQFAPPKAFVLPFDRGTVMTPTIGKEPMPQNVTPRVHTGTPFEPLGNPLTSGVGPASWAPRQERPDVDQFNRPRIVPARLNDHLFVAAGDTDPRGLPVVGLDDVIAGTVKDLWVDRSENLVRYLEVELTGGGVIVVPMPVCEVSRRRVLVDAVTAAQIAEAPVIGAPDQITLREEDQVQAYFGAGYLWATPSRREPLL